MSYKEIVKIILENNVDIPELKKSKDVQSYNMNCWSESKWLSEAKYEQLKKALL